MYTRLVIAVLFVAAVTAQGNTSGSAPTLNNNATVGTGSNATGTGSNATIGTGSNATSTGSNATIGTGSNATAGTGSNATGTGSNATIGTGSNATAGTGSNATGTGSNATAGTGSNATTTTPAPTTSIPVGPLNATISRAGCGTQEFCAAQPLSCDPSTAGSCYFLSAQLSSGLNYLFGLSGNSSGYIAVILSTDNTIGNNDTTYICANNNGTVQFLSAYLNNNVFTIVNLGVSSVKGNVNGTKIQCTFNATVPTSTTRALPITFSISNGTYNNSVLGAPTNQFTATVTDLSNPNSSLSNHGVTIQQPVTQALLILVGVLGLAMQ